MKQPPSLPVVTDSNCGSGSVPVFNCIVILHPDAATGRIHARIANLPNIHAEGSTERDVLLSISRQFKTTIQALMNSQQTIPWVEPPERAATGESERFIPIHL